MYHAMTYYMTAFTLPKWFDAHTHLRQDALIEPILQSQIDMGCYAILAMPNTKPPVSRVHESDAGEGWSIETYSDMIMSHGVIDHLLTPLYLTRQTTTAMIEAGAKSGMLTNIKYYPPHGTTNADHGIPMNDFLKSDLPKAMRDNNVMLNIHGEQHGLSGADYFDKHSSAEDVFYREMMPRLIDAHPTLQIACEHVTTKTAVKFVTDAPENIGATITPQHLLYTVGHLIQGLKYHLFCLPVVKFEEDRHALREAVTTPANTKFFAGTDSAAHTVKATDCGCAAGCFTGGIAPQLYAQAFEQAGLDLAQAMHQDIFKNFLCFNGPDFYNLPGSNAVFTLTKTPQTLEIIRTKGGDITPLPLGLGNNVIPWSIKP